MARGDATAAQYVAPGGGTALRLTGSATTQVLTGPGVLQRVIVNTVGTTGTITIYDNIASSGKILAILDSTAGPVSLDYGINVDLGIRIVRTGSPDITIVYG